MTNTRNVEGTYEEVCNLYVNTMELRRALGRRLKTLKPGTQEGYDTYVRFVAVQRLESSRRQMMLDHPDAPPQG